MTRETKIGLLVGLGFIVVFAVLLSHNGSAPSMVASQPPIPPSPGEPRPGMGGGSLTSNPVTLPDNSGSPLMENPVPGPAMAEPGNNTLVQDGGSGLPSMQVFDDAHRGLYNTSSPAEGMAVVTDAPRDGALPPQRVAPEPMEPVATPVETDRESEPEVTNPPATAMGGGPAEATSGTGGGSYAVSVPSSGYEVKKGDSLVSICREVYKNASPKVIDFLVAANKGTIKDRALVRVGQKLVTPPLPADMFEPVQSATPKKSQEQLVRAGEAINGISSPGRRVPVVAPSSGQEIGMLSATTGTEKAPGTDRKSAGGTNGKTEAQTNGKTDPKAAKANEKGKADKDQAEKEKTRKPKQERPGIRYYEIQPKDTFGSIAQHQLGSRNRWSEIQQLNKDIDPSRMKPGMKIRLPATIKESSSADASSKRVAA